MQFRGFCIHYISTTILYSWKHCPCQSVSYTNIFPITLLTKSVVLLWQYLMIFIHRTAKRSFLDWKMKWIWNWKLFLSNIYLITKIHAIGHVGYIVIFVFKIKTRPILQNNNLLTYSATALENCIKISSNYHTSVFKMFLHTPLNIFDRLIYRFNSLVAYRITLKLSPMSLLQL